MKILSKHFSNVEGGCTYLHMVNELLKENGVKKVKLYKNWKNNKTVFEIYGKRYVIGDSSYIFNYDGFIELELFKGKVREINGTTITSAFSNLSLYGYGEKDIFEVRY